MVSLSMARRAPCAPDVVEGFALGAEHVVVGGEQGALTSRPAWRLIWLILLQGIGGSAARLAR